MTQDYISKSLQLSYNCPEIEAINNDPPDITSNSPSSQESQVISG
jgi:hypothetical protein